MKFDMTLATLQTQAFFVEPNFAALALEGMQDFNPQSVEKPTKSANSSITYEVIEGIAVIGVEGPMYKKDMGGMCQSVVSYDQLIATHTRAEEDSNVSKILYRADTPGGSVAGLEEFRERIASSSKEVIVYAENMLASAGMYAFTAGSKLYANESTVLGSIGVIVMYQAPKEQVLSIVSSNAPNKISEVADEKGRAKIKGRLDEYEGMFLDKLQLAYPDKERADIIEQFDRGGTIFATAAQKLGYVEQILPFQALLESLVEGDTLSSEKMANTDKGIAMTMEEIQANLETATATINAQKTEIVALTAKVEQGTDALAVATHAVKVGMEHGANSETILAAMGSESTVHAENAVLTAVMGTDPKAITTGEQVDAEAIAAKAEKVDAEALLAFAQTNKI